MVAATVTITTRLCSAPSSVKYGKVPTDPVSWYKHLGVDFKDWQPVSLSVRGNTCIGCHRLGIQFTSGKATLEVAGRIPIANA